MSVLTIEEALAQVREDAGNNDADVARKAAEASAIVIDYVTHADKETWTDVTAPGVIKAAAKIVLTHLYDDRDGDPLSPSVKNLLRRFRDPALA